MTRICMAGVTGWTGRAIAAGILDAGSPGAGASGAFLPTFAICRRPAPQSYVGGALRVTQRLCGGEARIDYLAARRALISLSSRFPNLASYMETSAV